ncbi:MAG TPA: phospholipid carrier-dependent glycosyltransferase [Candidatus Rubrimentiphilum sp.]|nr:phospholipid carrier-dependent glycosyltransferase [Candidatus Rubrimentiphilum sp.]
MSVVRPAVSAPVRLGLLLLAGLVVRLFFLGDQGFKNDIDSFEAWAITLASHPLSQFYTTTKFVDYPTGYFYILWFIGHLFAVISPQHNYDVLRVLVKLPAILMDLVDGALLYALVRRYANERWALSAAALFVLNPAVIFISASWGQVDSVAGGLALGAAYLLLRSDDFAEGFAWQITAGWLLLAYSLLIKPQAAVLVPLFVVFAFVSPEQRARRALATAAGIVCAVALAFLLTVPFHPTANPINALAWLYERYQVGKDVYADNSVNAFNLWSIVHPFWQPDSQLIAMWPQYLWGVVLTGIAVVLVLVRYAQARTSEAFIEAAALSTLAFFMLSTRMHERYLFNGLLFTIAAAPFAIRYLWASVIFSGTLLVNLFYSLTYLTVVTQSTAGVNAADMWPFATHPLSALNVLTFFYLGYVFLGQSTEQTDRHREVSNDPEVPLRPGSGQAPGMPAVLRPHAWFNPREGLATMLWPLDYILAGAFGVISFILSYVNYWLPAEKIFDEIYFARAAEEYLSHKYIYENTHPPLTKLIITLSTMLFGGDNPHGWRFLDVVFGALAIVVIYAFAKRLTRSTLFASFAAVLFIADGMHFVQSRIATPEGIVVVFALGSLYAFYRYWIASQSTVRAYEPRTFRRAGISIAAALIAGYILGALVTVPFHQSTAAFVVAGLYFAFGLYLLLRLAIVPRMFGRDGEFASYAEGSRLLRQGGVATLEIPDGRIVRGKGLQIDDDGVEVAYARDGGARYITPEGEATYTPGLVRDDRGEQQEGRHATAWLIAFTILLGALVASKWYGVMTFGVSFVVVAGVWLERYWRNGKLKLWGNPFGFRLDISIAAIVFLSMTVYLLVWVPDFIRQIELKSLTDLIYRQYSMFMYHDTLKATHPYASAFWTWPIDLRPIAYYWKDTRIGAAAAQSTACCVSEIMSLPNPLILWFGLVCVPIVAFLAWRERNKGYALLVIAYLLQWLPWARSPRITFIYHFYVDIPIIILCNVIVLQRIWHWGDFNHDAKLFSRIAVGTYVAAVVLAFVWFYPVLAASPVPWDQWNQRMWIGRWII